MSSVRQISKQATHTTTATFSKPRSVCNTPRTGRNRRKECVFPMSQQRRASSQDEELILDESRSGWSRFGLAVISHSLPFSRADPKPYIPDEALGSSGCRRLPAGDHLHLRGRPEPPQPMQGVVAHLVSTTKARLFERIRSKHSLHRHWTGERGRGEHMCLSSRPGRISSERQVDKKSNLGLNRGHQRDVVSCLFLFASLNVNLHTSLTTTTQANVTSSNHPHTDRCPAHPLCRLDVDIRDTSR
mgnify:CR=1 FL=1